MRQTIRSAGVGVAAQGVGLLFRLPLRDEAVRVLREAGHAGQGAELGDVQEQALVLQPAGVQTACRGEVRQAACGQEGRGVVNVKGD